MRVCDFKRIEDVRRILKKPCELLTYLHQKEMVKAMKGAEKILTIHLYPVWIGRKKRKCLLDLNEWSYHQIYICKNEGKIYYSLGHGRSSLMRENHSFFIQTFLERKDLRKKTVTAVLVTSKEDILAYSFYRGYAYVNHDVGSNWDFKLFDKVKKAKLPFSYITGLIEKPTIRFASKKGEIVVYQATKQDIWLKEIEEKLRKGLKCQEYSKS